MPSIRLSPYLDPRRPHSTPEVRGRPKASRSSPTHHPDTTDSFLVTMRFTRIAADPSVLRSSEGTGLLLVPISVLTRDSNNQLLLLWPLR